MLIHTTANTGWSNMSLSGLFVNMLQRLVTLSRGVAGDGVNKALKPWRTLDGFGRLGAPPAGAQMLPADANETFKPKPHHAARPLRRRERPGRLQHRRPRRPSPSRWCCPAASRPTSSRKAARPTCRAGSCWRALLLLLADLFISLWLRGLLGRAVRFGRATGGAATAALLLCGAVFVASPPARQPRPTPRRRQQPGPPPLSEEQALKGSLDIRLAYIVTGDKEVDDISKAGLEGLSEILRNRTSVEPADPVGLDLEKDEPRLYPLIYWPITSTQPALSPRASAALDRYLRTGGILFIDTRDQQLSFDRPAGGNPDLKRLLGGVETPPLVAMPPDHVLTKAFYLLSRHAGPLDGRQGLDRSRATAASMTASPPSSIGANDYAGAWAVDQRGRGIMPVVAGRRDPARDVLSASASTW